MAAILIVEDETKIARFIELELSHEGYTTDKAGDGITALELLEKESYDLVILDIMLPGINGLEVLRRLRRTSAVPVILLTARDAVMDKVAGLDAGADDYMTKPFAIEELLARIRRILRQSPAPQTGGAELSVGQLVLNADSYTVRYGGQDIPLTNREFTLLKTLLKNKNIVLSRQTLLNQVWGFDYFGETNIVDVYIRYLRQKIDDAFGINLIQTVRGVGYVIKDN